VQVQTTTCISGRSSSVFRKIFFIVNGRVSCLAEDDPMCHRSAAKGLGRSSSLPISISGHFRTNLQFARPPAESSEGRETSNPSLPAGFVIFFLFPLRSPIGFDICLADGCVRFLPVMVVLSILDGLLRHSALGVFLQVGRSFGAMKCRRVRANCCSRIMSNWNRPRLDKPEPCRRANGRFHGDDRLFLVAKHRVSAESCLGPI